MTTWTPFATGGGEPRIAGRLAGTGPRVLLLHGGPGISLECIRDLAEELAEENQVAWYQQRGLEPSASDVSFTIAEYVDDARRVLDELGWETAYVVGHSWGGHLAMHIVTATPDRVSGVLAVDPLGSVGDGRWSEFDAEMFRRTPESARERAQELDRMMLTGDVSADLAIEAMRLVWPAYYADPSAAPPMPDLAISSRCMAAMYPLIIAELPALAERLPGIRVPVGFVHGAMSPMPLAASTDGADRIPGAWVDVVDGAGHFIWVESPGAVRRALRRLTTTAPATEPST